MTQDAKKKTNCALCWEAELIDLIHLGDTPVANQIQSTQLLSLNQLRYPLDLVMCSKCKHIQIGTLVSPDILFENYPYLSNSNESTSNRFTELSKRYISEFELDSETFVLEIGSNDGYFLEKLALSGANVLGVDPAIIPSNITKTRGLDCINDYFSMDVARFIADNYQKPNLIIANNVLAHTNDLPGIFDGIRILMDTDTVLILEFSYVVDVFEKLLLDTIYHEHTSYHSIKPLIEFLAGKDLHIFRVERFEAHGGSARVFICKVQSRIEIEDSVNSAVLYEESLDIHKTNGWNEFKNRIKALDLDIHQIIRRFKEDGLSVAGYGLPAKFTTLFYSLNLDPADFDFIVDDNPLKIGKYAPGTALEIKHPDELKKKTINAVILFSWNYKSELVTKMVNEQLVTSEIVIPLPTLQVIKVQNVTSSNHGTAMMDS